ncbi:hypothetical protein D9M68_479610 [compost metagenome]
MRDHRHHLAVGALERVDGLRGGIEVVEAEDAVADYGEGRQLGCRPAFAAVDAGAVGARGRLAVGIQAQRDAARLEWRAGVLALVAEAVPVPGEVGQGQRLGRNHHGHTGVLRSFCRNDQAHAGLRHQHGRDAAAGRHGEAARFGGIRGQRHRRTGGGIRAEAGLLRDRQRAGIHFGNGAGRIAQTHQVITARAQPRAACRRRLQRGLDRRGARIGSHCRRQLVQRGLRRFQPFAELVEQLVLRVARVVAVGGHQRALERVDAAQVDHAGQHQLHCLGGGAQAAGGQPGLRAGVELVEEGIGVALCQRGGDQLGQRRDIGRGGGAAAGFHHRMQRGAIRRRDAQYARARGVRDIDGEGAVRRRGGGAAARCALGLHAGIAQRRAHRGRAADLGGRSRRGWRFAIASTAAACRQHGGSQTRQKQVCGFHPCISAFMWFWLWQGLRWSTPGLMQALPTGRLARPAGASVRERRGSA